MLENLSPTLARLVKIAAPLAVLLVITLLGYGQFNSVQVDGTRLEADLSQQYLNNQNVLSTYLATVKETLGVADRKTDALDAILTDAVKGRYETSGATTVETSQLTIKAIVEAYPDLAGLNVYDKVADQIISGRKEYGNQQTKLLSMLATYDTFTNGGLIHRQVASALGFPTKNLRAQIGDDIARGPAALDRMRDIVLVKEAKDAYKSGEMPVLDTNPTPKN